MGWEVWLSSYLYAHDPSCPNQTYPLPQLHFIHWSSFSRDLSNHWHLCVFLWSSDSECYQHVLLILHLLIDMYFHAHQRGWGRNEGQTVWQLAELKVIYAGSRDKAVEWRARLLPGKYRHTLTSLDQRCCGSFGKAVGGGCGWLWPAMPGCGQVGRG